MIRCVKIEPVCPFIGGKKCIEDGWQFNANTFHPCAFWDGDASYMPDEPCRIKRAVNKMLAYELQDDPGCTEVDVPWKANKE